MKTINQITLNCIVLVLMAVLRSSGSVLTSGGVVLISSGAVVGNPIETPPLILLDGYKYGTTTDNIVLDLGAGGTWDDAKILHPWAVKDGSTVYLFFAGNDGSTWKIGVATAPVSGFTGVNFTKYASNPVLSVGAGGEWDAASVYAPVVIYDEDAAIWKMWYSGQSAGGTVAIGYATASDPLGPWTKYGSNPILSPGVAWEGSLLGYQSVLREDATTYKMLYTANNINTDAQIGLATSTDGISWTKYASNPVITPAGGSGWMSVTVFTPRTLVKVGSTYYTYYAGKYEQPSAVDYSNIGYGTSSDLITWTIDNVYPILSATRTWEGSVSPPGEVEGPNYIQVGTTQYLFYDCWWGNPSTIGVAVIP